MALVPDAGRRAAAGVCRRRSAATGRSPCSGDRRRPRDPPCGRTPRRPACAGPSPARPSGAGNSTSRGRRRRGPVRPRRIVPTTSAPAPTSRTRPSPTSVAPRLKAYTPSSSTRSRTAVSRRRPTSTRSRSSTSGAASFTLTVVAAAITSPTSPVTAPVASRSEARYCLIRASSDFVTTATTTSGTTSTRAPARFVAPRTTPAIIVNTRPADTSISPSTNLATSSASSRKCVTASPAEPTGWPASGPPLATWAASMFARRNVCICSQTRVQTSAPPWIDAIRATSTTISTATQR